MRPTIFLLALMALIGAPSLANAAAASFSRLDLLPKRCAGAPGAGTPCTTDADCGGSRCKLALQPGGFMGTLTLIVDDDVSHYDGTESVLNVVGVAGTLEVRHAERTQIHAQLWQNLDGDTFETLVAALQAGPEIASNVGIDRRLTEQELADEAALLPELIDAFLFQSPDSELADAVREQLGVEGTPVVVKVRRVEYFDRLGDGLASVVRLKVKFKFLEP